MKKILKQALILSFSILSIISKGELLNIQKNFADQELKTSSKIKLYSFYTPSHEILLKKYFLPSIKDDYNIIIKKISQQSCPTGTFYSQNWYLAVANKADLIMDAIKDNWGTYFIYSDVDIQFFRPTKPYITQAMSSNKNLDLLGQALIPGQTIVSTGFMVIKANERSLNLWKDIKHHLLTQKIKGDQYFLNKLLAKHAIKHAVLPETFYLPSGKMWAPGKQLKLPHGIILHHASWTKGIENKIKQLEYVKSIVRPY